MKMTDSMKYIDSIDDQIETEKLVEKPLSEQKTQRSKKPFKVHYYKDEKSLQFSIALGSNEKNKKGSDENGVLSQLKHLSFYQACFAEFLGTYLLVLFAIGFGLNADPKDPTAGLTGALATGFTVATIIWSLAHIGGSHINPAVSFAFLLTGDCNIIKFLCYVICQLLGSICATMTLQLMIINSTPIEIIDQALLNNNSTILNEVVPSIGLTLLNPKISVSQGLGIEIIITFILITAILSCVDSKRTDLGGSFPLSIGLSVIVGALFGGQFTGGSMNPARSFGPAICNANMSNHWIYWIGPFAGASIAVLNYKFLTFKTSLKVTQRV